MTRLPFNLLTLLLALWGYAPYAVAQKPVRLHSAPVTSQPVMLTATLAANGTDTTVTFDRPVVAADAAGFTLIVAAVPRDLTLASGSGTETFVFTSEVVYEDEIVSLAYASAIGDAEDINGNDLENAGLEVVNNSTQVPTPDDTTPPQYVSSTVLSNGTNVTYVFDEAVELDNADGFTFTPSGGATTLTYVSGSGTTTISFTASRPIEVGETVTTEYSSTTGDVEDLYGNELATFGSTAVTNNSTYDSSDPYTPISPQVFIDTTYDLPTGGTTYTPADSSALNTALASAVGGDVIVLQAGTTYTVNARLRNWGAGTDWIYIISSNLASLPPEGERVGLDDIANMPTLTSTAGHLAPVHSDFGAHHYRLAGIRITHGAYNALTTVQLGYAGDFNTPADTEAEMPHHITFDRCVVGSTSDAHKLRHGIMLNGLHMAVVDSYIYNCKDTSDAQAIWTYDGPGPYKIVNDFLEATGENYLTGGSDTNIPGCIPSDIEFRRNHCYKPIAWKAPNLWGVKNSFELKNSQRHLISGNVFENNWVDAQDGKSILFTVRNQSGTNPHAVVKDVRFQDNIIKNVGSGFNITGEDNLQSSQQTTRILIDNNLVIVTRDHSPAPSFIQIATPNRPLLYTTITHNTFLIPAVDIAPYSHLHLVTGAPLPQADRFIWQNNVAIHGTYHPEWNRTSNSTHSNNVVIMPSASSRYPWNKSNFASQHPGDFMADADYASVGFVDFNGGNYRLAPGSPFENDGSDGTDPGCDFDELEAATAGTISGVWD